MADSSSRSGAAKYFLAACLTGLLGACGSLPPGAPSVGTPATLVPRAVTSVNQERSEIAMYAMGLLDTAYRFGGKNPEAGLDCSGLVSLVFKNALGRSLEGSAADMARRGRPVAKERLLAGDLVFFNTQNRPFSHVGLYIGDGRFIHAPSAASGGVRIERLANAYFAARFEGGRSYLD